MTRLLSLIFLLAFKMSLSFAQAPHTDEELDSLQVNYGVFYSLEEAKKNKEQVRFLNLKGSDLKTFPEEITEFPNLWGITFDFVRIYFTEDELAEKGIKLRGNFDWPVKKQIGTPFNGIPDDILEKMKSLKHLEWMDLTGTKTTNKNLKKIAKALPNCVLLPEPE